MRVSLPPRAASLRPTLPSGRRAIWIVFWAAVGGVLGWAVSTEAVGLAMRPHHSWGILVSALFLVPLGTVFGACSGTLWARAHGVYERRHTRRRAIARLEGRRRGEVVRVSTGLL